MNLITEDANVLMEDFLFPVPVAPDWVNNMSSARNKTLSQCLRGNRCNEREVTKFNEGRACR